MSDANIQRLLGQRSFTELGARQRARSLLDTGSFRELVDPFAKVISPWLPKQGIVPQADDGVVVGKGLIDGQPTVIIAIEGSFQGGSLGEVGGAKIAGALELAAEDNRNGTPTRAVLLLETGGVRLQEANLGLAAIAEIQAAIVDLRQYQPVIGLVAGPVGCFGGMSIAAGLCSYLLVTREARLGLNGPQVIEQEAGVDEYDSRDRPFIWSLTGGEQRYASGLVDGYLADDVEPIRQALISLFRQGKPELERSRRHAWFLERLQRVDTNVQADAAAVRSAYQGEQA
ncbi:MAG: biotin-independent malonate decarboxylase subunit beta [Gammaproteobacteria bacterium]|nr:biotin-independent malonate decarboxylase subunit beta [Gammaproteobacteria bacterium]MBU1490743.1 biotin-independent malonate decarboxylase subunit beta [Gammaproteobacteria bacterium]MBU2065651.1 biotin-independent malonate decarboxylase subunit beta [Gammaproteobacteria bacterium]MBU2137519.1 biotin-independent malonate decarboxylase subunit beta [Gammaproteobacteria bacterium]MBU2255073.1 biotin-independent malonate decarboxylase subunit beta [Gammaproteobacteria bacterium]